MKNQLIILKENPTRLLGDYFPEIMIDNREILDQEAQFEIVYKNKVIGRAVLHYRIPYPSSSLRESQTYLVYNKPTNWLHLTLSNQLKEGTYNSSTRLVYCLFRWIERDLLVFEDLFKQSWETVVNENRTQLQMEMAS
jgi:hypothetical protein